MGIDINIMIEFHPLMDGLNASLVLPMQPSIPPVQTSIPPPYVPEAPSPLGQKLITLLRILNEA